MSNPAALPLTGSIALIRTLPDTDIPPLGHSLREGFLARQAVILDLASRLERDRARCLLWFMDDPIRELDQHTAYELLCQGDDARVIAFLLKAIRLESRPGLVY